MAEITLDSFKEKLNALLDSNPHARNKGDDFKDWCSENFSREARISHIREQRQTTNRVSEQFRYFSPIVVFVCDSEVKRDGVEKYVMERTYKQLETIAIIGVTPASEDEDVAYNYTFEHLMVFKPSAFSKWAEPFFQKVEDAKAKQKASGSYYGTSSDDYQVVYYGAPGTGKSHQLKEDIIDEAYTRTIFHPDSDYSSFVGCYKPVDDGNRISYKYQPQAFVKAYVRAWLSNEPYYLVIEEINRGNCAQIFGDIFQLLDRNGGESEYEIEPDSDLQAFLAEEFAKPNNRDRIAKKFSAIPPKILDGSIMKIPSNLYIRATMNTSDQSLFPMDSAFKRRWSWKYFSIKDEGVKYVIKLSDGTEYDWWKTIEAINKKIFKTTKSADKQVGYWFAKLPEGETVITAEDFVSKVIFYLWNDVFKDYSFGDDNAFSSVLTFETFYSSDGHVIEQTVKDFMERNYPKEGEGATA